MEATEVFAFNGDHRDREQVRPYLAAYAELREAGTHYNDDFRGKIPGVEDGNPLMVLPKGKRNRGYEAGNGRTVLVK